MIQAVSAVTETTDQEEPNVQEQEVQIIDLEGPENQIEEGEI